MSFHDEDALSYRLCEGLEGTNKTIVFVVGSPISASYAATPGVADVEGVVELIRARFAKKGNQVKMLDERLANSEIDIKLRLTS
jgi:RNase H-fold protein (predicted Holliday junction resolvase)